MKPSNVSFLVIVLGCLTTACSKDNGSGGGMLPSPPPSVVQPIVQTQSQPSNPNETTSEAAVLVSHIAYTYGYMSANNPDLYYVTVSDSGSCDVAADYAGGLRKGDLVASVIRYCTEMSTPKKACAGAVVEAKKIVYYVRYLNKRCRAESMGSEENARALIIASMEMRKKLGLSIPSHLLNL